MAKGPYTLAVALSILRAAFEAIPGANASGLQNGETVFERIDFNELSKKEQTALLEWLKALEAFARGEARAVLPPLPAGFLKTVRGVLLLDALLLVRKLTLVSRSTESGVRHCREFRRTSTGSCASLLASRAASALSHASFVTQRAGQERSLSKDSPRAALGLRQALIYGTTPERWARKRAWS